METTEELKTKAGKRYTRGGPTRGTVFTRQVFEKYKGNNNTKRRPPSQNEFALHRWIVERLAKDAGDAEYDAEVKLGDLGRIDFVISFPDGYRLGIEAKTDGRAAEVARQLFRYAGSGRLDEVMLLTTKPMEINVDAFVGEDGTATPIRACELWKAAL